METQNTLSTRSLTFFYILSNLSLNLKILDKGLPGFLRSSRRPSTLGEALLKVRSPSLFTKRTLLGTMAWCTKTLMSCLRMSRERSSVRVLPLSLHFSLFIIEFSHYLLLCNIFEHLSPILTLFMDSLAYLPGPTCTWRCEELRKVC